MTDRTVTVSGQGSATTVPDCAVLSLAAVHRAASVQDAFDGTASAVEVLLRTAGEEVAESRIGSRGINIWGTNDRQGRPDGFECRHSVAVRCPSLDVAGRLLGRLVDAVGDRLQVDGVSLEVSDPGPAEVEARVAAYADAVRRATQLAALAGATLGEVLAVTEGGGGHVVAARAVPAMAQREMPVAAGEQSVGASLTVVFALEAAG